MKPRLSYFGGLGGWEILIFLLGLLIPVFIYYLGYRYGTRTERLKNLEERVKKEE